MSDTGDGAQAAAQSDDTSAQAAGTTDQTATPPAGDTDTISAEAARKLRSEAQSLRSRLKALEEANLSDTEKKQRDLEQTASERDTLRAELNALRTEKAAADAGAIDPELLASKIPADILGDPKALKAHIAALKERFPNQFRTGTGYGNADGAAGGGRAAPTDMNSLLRRAAGRG